MNASPGRGRIAVGPEGVPAWMAEAVGAGGGEVVPLSDAEALLWGAPADPSGLREALERTGDRLRWVQLPWAGIEPYVGALDDRRLWTCGKGVYAEPVAEMALTLALACLRGLDRYARATRGLEHGHLQHLARRCTDQRQHATLRLQRCVWDWLVPRPNLYGRSILAGNTRLGTDRSHRLLRGKPRASLE